jgi:YceI-like domain
VVLSRIQVSILSAFVLIVVGVIVPGIAQPTQVQDRDGQPSRVEDRDGVWQVVPAESFVGYRIRERLGFLPAPSDAVGRTSSIVGSVGIMGMRINSAAFTTDLRTLKSDQSRRDGCVVSRLGNKPRARFTMMKPVQLPTLAAGLNFSFSANANLRLHGVTRRVIFPLKGRWSDDRFQVVGRLRVRLSDYRISKLTAGRLVLSVSKFGTIEVQLSFARQ